MRSEAAAKLPLILPQFSSRCTVFFVASLNSYEQTAILNVCCNTDPTVAWKVARKCENLCLNSLRDVLSIWHCKQCFSLRNEPICIKGHLGDFRNIKTIILYFGKQNLREFWSLFSRLLFNKNTSSLKFEFMLRVHFK